jgi:hypothetical protein
MMAVRQLTDQNLLFKIAMTDTDCTVRLTAVNGIIDFDLLWRLIEQSPDTSVRSRAFAACEFPMVEIEEKARSHPLWKVRSCAVGAIWAELMHKCLFEGKPDIPILLEVAKTDPHEAVRKEAREFLEGLERSIKLNLTTLNGRTDLAFEPLLECRHCSRKYIIGVDATIIPIEAAYRQAPTLILSDGTTPVRTDLVDSLGGDIPPERLAELLIQAKEDLCLIYDSIRDGDERYWYCKSCNNDKRPFSYPAKWWETIPSWV